MYDEKREYLIKTFSRTKRKDYENYILTAIGHRIHNNNIQPVTQQYIKLNNGKSVASGWTNLLSDDGNAIMESNYDISKINPMGKLAHPEKYRITFGKRKDILGRNVYRFLGIFKFDKMENNTNYYKRGVVEQQTMELKQ